MGIEEHSPPHEGQEEYQGDRVDDAVSYQQDRVEDENHRVERAEDLENDRVARAEELKNDRVARAEELERLAKEKSRIHRRIAIWQLAAYLLIFTVSAVGWWQIEQEADARCESGEINRQALRNIITGVGDLGTELVTQGKTPTTPEQEAALAQFEKFEDKQLALLEGPVCPAD